MNEKELRIGNYVHFSKCAGRSCRRSVVKISIMDIGKLSRGTYSRFYNPIPLTEEWLLGFGFIEDKPSHINIVKKAFYNIDFAILINKNGGFDMCHRHDNGVDEYSTGDWIRDDIKYVHTLQNLYFSLTGEELEFKK